MNFILRPHIDVEKWDYLVAKTRYAGIYNYSYFLDSVCENWCIYVDEHYSVGIAIPFTNKLKTKLVYTPNYLRCLNLLGEINQKKIEAILKEIKNEFSSGDLAIENLEYELNGKTRVYQQISRTHEIQINTLSKRMLKKFDQSQLRISSNVELESVFSFLESNLFQRIQGLTKSDFILFKKLIINLNNLKMLKICGVVNSQNEFKGCSLFVQTKEKLIYIKGVASQDAMKDGAMYAMLFKNINEAHDNNLDFDFGGSNINSIKQFYSNLGGQDTLYSRIIWGNQPLYYKIAKYIYHFIGKFK